MNRFLIVCYLDISRAHLLNELRPSHLSYVKSMGNVVYGGVMMNEADEYTGICYVIKAETILAAENFVKTDPYFEVYSSYEISKFVQKIPQA